MLTLVRRARRRLFSNELLSQGANAISAALGAFILLLLVGTQILSWTWALLIPATAVVVGYYRARKRLPSAYGVAQIVDRRMELADTLSTALFFSQHQAASQVSPEVRTLQFERAERLSESVDVRKAIPFTVPRTVYLMGALVLVASSLFALRYGLTRRLDLKPPLASILEQTFGSSERVEQAKNNRRLPQPEPITQPEQSGDNVQDPDQKGGDQPDSESATTSEESNDLKPSPGDSKAVGDGKKQAEEGEKSDSDQKDGQGDERAGEGENPNGQKGDNKSDPKDSSAKQDANNSGDNSSLMSKVKDAVQNLLSRMKPQQSQSGQQQQAANDQKNSQSKGQQNGSKQQASKDGQQQNGGQQSDAQEGQSGEQAQNSQDPEGKGTGKSDNQQASKQPGSGIGSHDGDKNIKQAEQLAAMGKITEIFGKRSANITGEATVEVQNTSQQLRTPYAQRGAQHSQGGAEINRDEIPVALQTYVEQYFEQVRKQQPVAVKGVGTPSALKKKE